MSFKRISLNLVHYFQDHRKLSRICLKDVETINDLQKYICKVFNIENCFYLICNNFYLPPSESIELLDDNELVYVMPDFRKEQQTYEEKSKDKNTKKVKKLKEIEYKHKIENEEISEEIYEKKKKKKEKTKKKSEINQENTETNDPKPYHLKNTHLNDMVQVSNKIVNNTSNINNELEMEICSNSDETQNTVKTNVEIDETIADADVTTQIRPRKKRRCISPRETTHNHKQNETCTQNKITIQSVEVVNENMQQKIIESITKNPTCITYSLNEVMNFENKRQSGENKNKQLKNTQHMNGNTEQSDIDNKRQSGKNKEKQLNNSDPVIEGVEKTKEQLLTNENKRQSMENIEKQLNNSLPQEGVAKTKRQLCKEILGIGFTLQSLSESDASSFMEDNFITRRRRSRVRRRKKKNNENEESEVTNHEFIPPKTIANPKMHIKFDNHENEAQKDKINEDSFVCSTPMKVNNIEETINDSETENTIENLTLNDIDVTKCTNLLGMPSVHDLIKFKTLKIGENYTPQVSDYILATVEDINDQQLKMKILDGKQEFREPMGRFSCIYEENEDDLEEIPEVVLDLNSLIEPKLCKL